MFKKWIIIVSNLLMTVVSAQTFGYQPLNHQRSIETIVFMRHGEKPPMELGQLNCQGLNRALALPKRLHAKFGKPDYIMAPNPYSALMGKTGIYYYVRALATIEPTAIQYDVPVSTDYAYYNYRDAAKALIAPKYRQALIFVSWEHLNIPPMVKQILELIDAEKLPIPSWPGSDYDSLYVLSIDWQKTPPKVSFLHDHEDLNDQSTICPTIENKNHDHDREQTVIFIPQAEQSISTSDQLSCKGLNRALALPKVLRGLYPDIDVFVIPSPILNDVSKGYIRALMTLEPLVISAQATFATQDESIISMVNYLNSSLFYSVTIAVAWPMSEIPSLAKAFYASNGGNPDDIPNPVRDRDIMYQIKINRDLKVTAKFKAVPQRLDNLSETCPYSINNKNPINGRLF